MYLKPEAKPPTLRGEWTVLIDANPLGFVIR